MSIFDIFRKRRSDPDPAAIAEMIYLVARQEFTEISKPWPRKLSDGERVAVFFEYAMVLFNVADRLAFGKYGDPQRAKLMSATVSELRQRFCARSQDPNAIGNYFDSIFDRSNDRYAGSQSVMGDTSLTEAATVWICRNFAFAPGEAPDESVVLSTGRSLINAVLAMLATDPFKPLTRSAG